MIKIDKLSFVLNDQPVVEYKFNEKSFLFGDGKKSTMLYCSKHDATKVLTICAACGYDAQDDSKPNYVNIPWYLKDSETDYRFIVLIGFDNRQNLKLRVTADIW